MIKYTTLLIALVGSSTATAAPHRHAFEQVNGAWVRSPDGCGTPQVSASPTGPSAAPLPHAPGLRTVFLNRFGGTYTAGATDAATNKTQLVNGGQITIPPLNTTTFDWNVIAACVRTHFDPFNIRVVETEPTAGTFIEAVVGGDGTELGFGPNELFGIASADNFCNVTGRGIAFNFSETHKQVPRRNEELCATIAHEVGHLIALEHEQLPQDLMSYVLIADSNTKAFVDQASGCGVAPNQPNNCSCSSNPNSHARIAQFIGLRPIETEPPTLAVSAPGGANVPPAFEVVATATDNDTMSDVSVNIDGLEAGNDFVPDGDTYKVLVKGVAEGAHTLAVIATDAAGNQTTKEIQITVKLAATGEDCAVNEACSGGLCAVTEDGGFCTQACNPESSTCPDGFSCDTVSGQTICVPEEGGGGCCSSSSNPEAAMLLGLGVVALVLRRRRRS